MFELLQKLAMEGWWVWASVFFVVTIAFLARHRVGLAALVKRWEPWQSGEEIKKYLAEGEKIRHLDGPVLITDHRILLRKRARGFAYAEGAVGHLCSVEYNETWLLPSTLFGIAYVILGGVAFILSGKVLGLAILGALIALAGLVLLIASLVMKPASLILTFGSGKPIILSGRWQRERLEKLLRELAGGR